MKTAVVFYSHDGNCALVAEQLKVRLNADMLRLQTKDEKQRGGFAKYFWGGGMVIMNKRPALKPYNFDPASYDLIILGAPVWAGSPAPPLKTFIAETKISGKKTALFVCHAGGKGNALDKFKSLLAGSTVAAETDFFNPSKTDLKTVNRQIDEWVKTFDV